MGAGISGAGNILASGLTSAATMGSPTTPAVSSDPFSGSYRDYKAQGGSMSRKQFKNF
jgi:hypothetical protein